MAPQFEPFDSNSRLADRLSAAGRTRFVGRKTELELFHSVISAAEPSFSVLHVYGPGGIGKTTLVREWARIAREAGRPVVRLDMRNLEPAPDIFLAALGQALGDGGAASPTAVWPARGVLILDTYEAVAALDPWLRETFLPQLPAQTLVVIAGRQAPTAAWTTDIEWAPLTRVLALRNLGPEESQAYLTLRSVPSGRHADLLAATLGHPLALSLAADAFRRNEQAAAFQLGDKPDIVRVLLEKLTQDVPSAQHRLALYGCAFPTAVTEPLLAAALAVDDAHETFDWLARQSFIEHGPHGLFPHDLAREVLCADARWRNRDMCRLLNERLLTYLYGQLQRASGIEQQRIWFDVIYLQRYNTNLQPYFVWTATGTAYADPISVADSAPMLDMVEQHEGAASKAIAAHWLRRQPDAFLAFRDRTGALIGFMAHLRLEQATAEDAAVDPAVPAVQRYMHDHGAIRPREEVSCLRFIMARDTYQGRSPSFNVLTANTSLYWTTHPKLAWSFVAVAEPDLMAPLFTSLHLWRAAGADFTVGNRRYGVFGHDWRVEPTDAWLRAKVDRATSCEATPQPPPQPLLVLSQADFAEAVRQALRDYVRPDRLAENRLLRTRLCRGNGEAAASVETLRGLLVEATNVLSGNPKDQKLHRALWHTFLDPAATQERAAEHLDLPFNTYRYQLAKGIERVTEWLWQRELDGSATPRM